MSDAKELVTIATFAEPSEANMARMVLEGAGYEVVLRGEVANSLIPVAFSSQLQVRAEDAETARAVLASIEDAPASEAEVTAAEEAAE